ncbi:FmdB family zinc ribbon protein [Orrella daihaiensis]|uniref:Zinc ribbon domain-containing protein n=1 Tax=Orrella daihaiensis TaxID=2782176 RepID=A0ABY4AJI2_9BURK|nr:FmdB family zinc ribbon protein [Orrella daihaiensis]UOD50442.1 zinc ribbon domain-containing protein [Orrella daihaiensis]
MPIYAYRCSNCGHEQDVLQKMSDAPLTQCPACGQSTYAKQVTAAGFQLKGSGWYVTDFRNNGAKSGASTGKTAQTAESASDSSSSSSSDASSTSPASTPAASTKAESTAAST